MQRKHASPGMFFIINERLLSPPYGSMFCAAPFLSPRPVPCFPPSPSPPTCQSKIMIEPGWQAVSHQHGKWGLVLCLSLPPFSCPLASWSFPPHLLRGPSVPPSPTLLLPCCPCTVPPPHPLLWKSRLRTVPVQTSSKWLPRCHRALPARPQRGRPGIINK